MEGPTLYLLYRKNFIILHTCLEICSKIELFNSVLQCLCHSYANYATVFHAFPRFAEILAREVSQLQAHGSRWVLIVICFPFDLNVFGVASLKLPTSEKGFIQRNGNCSLGASKCDHRVIPTNKKGTRMSKSKWQLAQDLSTPKATRYFQPKRKLFAEPPQNHPP